MVITCDDLWREISNYLDGEVGAELQLAIDGHLRECKRCAAVFGGTRNVIELYGDERMQQVPSGFSSRLHQTLKSRLLPNRRHFLGWIVATAATSTEMLYQSMPLRAQAARRTPSTAPAKGTCSFWRPRAHENRSTNATDRPEAFLLEMHRR